METLKFNKMVAVIAVLTLTFTQSAPAGLAAVSPADELRARSVSASVDALGNPAVATNPASVQKKPAASLDSIVFQLNENTLSPATSKRASEVVPSTNELELSTNELELSTNSRGSGVVYGPDTGLPVIGQATGLLVDAWFTVPTVTNTTGSAQLLPAVPQYMPARSFLIALSSSHLRAGALRVP